MVDDIVTRLRETAREERPLWRSQMVEAANEIERLRATLYCAESDRDHYHERFDLNQKCLDFIYKKKAWWKR